MMKPRISARLKRPVRRLVLLASANTQLLSSSLIGISRYAHYSTFEYTIGDDGLPTG